MRLPVQAAGVGRGVVPSSVNPSISACVNVSIENGQACIDIPIIGKHCLSIPSFIPSGTVAQACFNTCGSFIPTGACVTVKALGQQVAHECFGSC